MATVTATEPTAMVTAMPVITATEMIEETGESIWSSLVDDGDDDVNPDVAAETEDGAVENEAASLYLPPPRLL